MGAFGATSAPPLVLTSARGQRRKSQPQPGESFRSVSTTARVDSFTGFGLLRACKAFQHHHSDRVVVLTLGAALAAFAAKPACRAVPRFRWRFLHLFARSTGRSDVCIACMPGGFRHLLGSSLPVELADRCRNRREELPNCPARKRSSRQICRLISQVGAGTAKVTAKLPGMQAKCSSNQPFDLTGGCRSRKSKCETARHAGYAAKSGSSCTYL